MVKNDWFEELDWKNFEKDQKFLVMFLEYGRKIPVAEQYFRNFKGYNNFSKVSPYFKKMANSLRPDL